MTAAHKCTSAWMPDADEWKDVEGLVERCGDKPKTVFDCERGCGIAKVRGTTVLVDFEKKALISAELPCPNKEISKGDGGTASASASSQPSVKHARADISQRVKELALPAGKVEHAGSMAALDEVYMASLQETQRLVVQESHKVAATQHRLKMHRLTTFLLTHATALCNALVGAINAGGGKAIKRTTIKRGATGSEVPQLTAAKNILTLLLLTRATLDRYDHLSAVNRDVWGKSKGFPSITSKAKWFEEVANRYTPDITHIYDTLHHSDGVFVDIAPKLDANAYYTLGVHVASRNTTLVTQWIRAERKRERDAAKELGWKPADTAPASPSPAKPSPVKPPAAAAAGAAAAAAAAAKGTPKGTDKATGAPPSRKRRRGGSRGATAATAADAAITADE